ncbi:MAG: polysaccharide biosynthesis C-terminal domain-containing protein [Pilosibacter sp.]
MRGAHKLSSGNRVLGFRDAHRFVFVPILLGWLNTPDSVMVEARLYFGIYFAGVSTVIMYNICMNIMRAVGDSVHPLYYLIFSSIVNMILDLIFVAGFQWSAAGAAVATVIAQGLSVLLCMIRMVKDGGAATIHFKELRFNGSMIRQVITQGLPTGLQNSVISVGNLVVQSNINTFGAFAISGQGAFAKLEGLPFFRS